MWFGKSKAKRKRRQSNSVFDERRSDRLWVRARAAVTLKTKWIWFGRALVILVSLLSVLVMAWVGLRYLDRCLLRQNDLFRIRNFKIECIGKVITAKHIMDYAQLSSCSNLFAMSIAEKREYLLKTVPRVKSVEMLRRLPGELIIRVRERISLARLEMKGYYLTVDREGHVLGASTRALHLPIISGHCMPGIRPGMRLAGTAVMNALEVFDVCETTPVRNRLKVVRIEVRSRGSVELTLADGEQVILAWQNMGAQDALSRQKLEQKLARLAEILKRAAAQGKRIAGIDMTLENNFPVPEYY